MIRLIAIGLSMLLSLPSCTKDNGRLIIAAPDGPIVSTGNGTVHAKSYLALGDSYTIGQSVTEADRFPVQTARYLTSQGIDFGSPEIIARTGWTTANLLNGLSLTPPLNPSYDIVTLLIGVNNQYQHRTKQEYANEFSVLLGKAIQYAGNKKQRVIVLSIPDYSVTPYAAGSDTMLIAKEIDSFNIINKNIATQMGVNYLDITGSSRLAANEPALIAPDGLHPSGMEYKLWADALVPMIKIALQ